LIPDVLIIRLIASFASGFAVVALITALADIGGQGPAGFLGGIPSAGPVSLLFIGLTQSQVAAVQATSFFPLGFSSTFAFLLFYAIPKTLRFSLRMTIALGLWLPISAAIALWGPADYPVSLAASVVIVVAAFAVRRRIPTEKAEARSTTPTLGVTFLRGTLGGLVVMSVVVLSEVSGPQVGGAFAAAPAIWTSSLYVTSRTRGIEFSRSLTLSFMQTAIFTLIPYGVAARYFFATSGIWWGTLFSFAAISPLALLAWWLVNRRGDGFRITGC
jgi:uncharacterized membrane protein (GlpM family)